MREGIVPTLVTTLVTFLAVVFCVGAAGGGHGTYVPAKLFFPWSMLGAEILRSEITMSLVALALAQPFVYLTIALRRPSLLKIIGIAHALAAAGALLYPSSAF